MEFFSDNSEIVCKWTPEAEFEGEGGILHGGVQAALIDEIANWYIQVFCGTVGATVKLDIRYLHPVSIKNGAITLHASFGSRRKNIVTVRVELNNSAGSLCTTAHADFFTVSPEIAERDYGYPGPDAYLES
jgi:acyl-coenzyme A thioesterase PaaI-like protein